MTGFQQIWEKLRQEGKNTSKYPYDKVISFVFRYYKKIGKRKSDINILEVGCGAGNNLYALASEGFNVAGVDGSKTAIEMALDTFKKRGLRGKFVVQDFTEKLPFSDEQFDMVIDRSSITYVSYELAKVTVAEIHRIMKKGGYFFFNPYSQEHYTYLSNPKKDVTTYVDTLSGTIAGTGKVCFYNECMIREILHGFEIKEFRHLVIDDLVDPGKKHAEFEVICEKI